MQPLNEALLTDEEFLALTSKKLVNPIREQGNITLRAETVQRLLDIIAGKDKEIRTLLQPGDKVLIGESMQDPEGRVEEFKNDIWANTKTLGQNKPIKLKGPLFCTERQTQHKEGYLKLRTHYERKADCVYRVVLSVVNRPCGKDPSQTLFAADKAFLTEQMDRLLGNVIGETSHHRARTETQHCIDVEEHLRRFTTIKPECAAGSLIEYELESVRDGSGSIAIIGVVGVTPEAAAMIEDGHVFALRSLIEPKSPDIHGSKLNKIISFDLLMAAELDVTI